MIPGSYNNLNGFSLAIWELGTGKAPRCYSVEPSNWKRAHNTPGVVSYLTSKSK